MDGALIFYQVPSTLHSIFVSVAVNCSTMMERRMIWSLLLVGLFWIIDNDTNMFAEAKTTVPTPSPWFRGAEPSPIITTPLDSAPKRHKKIRKVKKKKQSTHVVSKANEQEITDNDGGASILKETNKGHDSQTEEISTSEETASVGQNGVSAREGIRRKKKKKRRVKVRWNAQVNADDDSALENPEDPERMKTPTAELSTGVIGDDNQSMADIDAQGNDDEATGATFAAESSVHVGGGQDDRVMQQEGKDMSIQPPLAEVSIDIAEKENEAVAVEMEKEEECRGKDFDAEEHVNSEMDAFVTEKANEKGNEMDGREEVDEENVGDASTLAHHIFEKEIVRVNEDYIPNLAEFDSSASEERMQEEELLADIASEVMAAEEGQNDEEQKVTEMEGQEEIDEENVQVASTLAHQIFEREIVRVDEDYIPNLAEFDSSASEERTQEAEVLADIASEVRAAEAGQNDEEKNELGTPDDVEENAKLGDSEEASDDGSDDSSPTSEAAVNDANDTKTNVSKTKAEQDDALIAMDSEASASRAAPVETASECPPSTSEQSLGTGSEKDQVDPHASGTINALSNESDHNLSYGLVEEICEEAAVDSVSFPHVGLENKETESESRETVFSTIEQTYLDVNSTRMVVEFQDLDTREDDDSDLTVSVVTWNLAEASPSEEEASFIRRFRDSPKIGSRDKGGSDIVLISGQECENTKPRRAEGHRSREFRRLMIKMLGRKYVPLAIHSLGGVQFGLFCKRSLLGDIEFVSIADVACGIGNVFHNKGAIAAFMQIRARERKVDASSSERANASKPLARAKSLRMLFVTAHMAAHVKHVEARNADYWRISSELEAQAPPRFLPPPPLNQDHREGDNVPEEGSGSHLMDSVDRVFFCGDLNYRLDLPRELAEHTVSEMLGSNRHSEVDAEDISNEEDRTREKLLLHDQLLQTIADGRAFPFFAEGKINFPPTFKFDRGTKDYDTSHKQRIPAWTDRILFKPFGVRVLEYSSVVDATHSDHRPVYASFRVNMQGRELRAKELTRRRRPHRSTPKND